MFLGLALSAAAAQFTHAAAPQLKTQAPGFYRMMLGDFEVTALNDGVIAYPTKQVLLMGALQFADPALRSSFDADPKAAAEQRLRIFKIASADGSWVALDRKDFGRSCQTSGVIPKLWASRACGVNRSANV